MVNQDAARGHAGQHAVLTVHNGANIVVISNAQKDEPHSTYRILRRVSHIPMELFLPSLSFRFRAIEHAHLVSRLL